MQSPSSPPVPYCPHGPYLLAGTGFELWDNFAGSTGWLTTTAPATGGEEIRLRLAIWDAGDAGWDATVILDHFRWLAEPAMVATIPAPR